MEFASYGAATVLIQKCATRIAAGLCRGGAAVSYSATIYTTYATDWTAGSNTV